MEHEIIWYKDLSSFLDMKYIIDVIPSHDMTITKQLNALLRFSILFAFLLYSIYNRKDVIYIVIIIAIITLCIDKNTNMKAKVEEDYMNIEDESVEQECTLPTEDNPFMNVLMNEYEENPQRGKACDVSKVHKKIDEHIGDKLYRSLDDLNDTSTRQYYTMPNTNIPNNQEGFAKWLYEVKEPTCKEGNLGNCKYF